MKLFGVPSRSRRRARRIWRFTFGKTACHRFRKQLEGQVLRTLKGPL